MRILLIEDEQKIANALKMGLEMESYAVDVAYDGVEGYGRALVGKFDLLILDRMLPGLKDGLEILKAMREKGLIQPVLVLTARDTTKDRVDGLDTGADDYLVKPFSFEELLARVRALLRRPSATTEPVLLYDELALDPRTRAITRAGKLVELSRKESAVVEYFLRHPERYISKEELIAHVWDFDADILPNTVEAFMKAIREKIDRPHKKKPLFHTKRQLGYILSLQP